MVYCVRVAPSRDGVRFQDRIGPGGPAGRAWQEWVIVLSILALAGIGVGAIWGPTIHHWIGEMRGDQPAEKPGSPGLAEPGGPQL